MVSSSVFGADAPSNRLNLALIGAGNQSRVDLPAVLRFDDVQVVAVCDVNRGSYGYARPEHFLGREPVRDSVNEYYAKKTGAGTYRGCDVYADFREVLARDDVDAVMVILPDHWHALVSVLACRAGKDVYCQKPMSLTVHDGQQMIKAVREHKRILQVGSQYRSNAVVRRVAELVRNGRIGKVQRAIAIVNDSGPGPGPGWQPMPVPEGFDYDFWLGPAPQAPYHIDRCLYRFRFHLDYSGGQVTNTGHHANDIVQWVLGLDGTEPVEYEDLGSVWPPAGHLYTTAMKTAFRARHANGIELICQTQDPGFGAAFRRHRRLGPVHGQQDPGFVRQDPQLADRRKRASSAGQRQSLSELAGLHQDAPRADRAGRSGPQHGEHLPLRQYRHAAETPLAVEPGNRDLRRGRRSQSNAPPAVPRAVEFAVAGDRSSGSESPETARRDRFPRRGSVRRGIRSRRSLSSR